MRNKENYFTCFVGRHVGFSYGYGREASVSAVVSVTAVTELTVTAETRKTGFGWSLATIFNKLTPYLLNFKNLHHLQLLQQLLQQFKLSLVSLPHIQHVFIESFAFCSLVKNRVTADLVCSWCNFILMKTKVCQKRKKITT